MVHGSWARRMTHGQEGPCPGLGPRIFCLGGWGFLKPSFFTDLLFSPSLFFSLAIVFFMVSRWFALLSGLPQYCFRPRWSLFCVTSCVQKTCAELRFVACFWFVFLIPGFAAPLQRLHLFMSRFVSWNDFQPTKRFPRLSCVCVCQHVRGLCVYLVCIYCIVVEFCSIAMFFIPCFGIPVALLCLYWLLLFPHEFAYASIILRRLFQDCFLDLVDCHLWFPCFPRLWLFIVTFLLKYSTTENN